MVRDNKTKDITAENLRTMVGPFVPCTCSAEQICWAGPAAAIWLTRIQLQCKERSIDVTKGAKKGQLINLVESV